uniref:Glycoside hydrolase family 19 catalytic domain-containing protein n=1 Tax=Picea sitchensis TaxID=3332 RepID=A9NT20_PICSI|nr:unknown [Picea sitchensis]
METKQIIGSVNRMLVVVGICLVISSWLCCIEPAAAADEDQAMKSKKIACIKGAECKNKTISELFTVDQFESLFSHRNAPMAHAQGFWDYHSFITAAAHFEPKGFGATGGDLVQKKELAAFFAHVATETSCESLMAQSSTATTDSPTKWGLCYKEELSPDSTYCESSLVYPCAPGVSYHGRGALPVYWNYNYGQLGQALKVDLLHHAEDLSQNATLAFQAAMWRWMNPIKVKQPSAHQVMVGKWVPTKNDTNSLRHPGFGMTINILKGEAECGDGSDDKQMNKRIAHYLYFLDQLDVGRDNAGDNLDCSDQKVLNPSSAST